VVTLSDIIEPFYPKKTEPIKPKPESNPIPSKEKKYRVKERIEEAVSNLIKKYPVGLKKGERFQEIDNYVTYNLTIMLRKKYKKRGKGWREHPPTWYYDFHKLVCLRKMCTNIRKRYATIQEMRVIFDLSSP
jgi:hypothetical protein